jgi:hypothetical protein
VILRCTRKLLDVIKPAGLAEDAPSPEDWYANLLKTAAVTLAKTADRTRREVYMLAM